MTVKRKTLNFDSNIYMMAAYCSLLIQVKFSKTRAILTSTKTLGSELNLNQNRNKPAHQLSLLEAGS
jgi:hypothetical protein